MVARLSSRIACRLFHLQPADVVLSESAPAKVNLSLAVVGRRPDGFHDLVSVVAPITLADTLEFSPSGRVDQLVCDDASLPTDSSNLVLRAAEIFRRVVPATPYGRFSLTKRVPHGAGLGGGSSDAAAALRLLNQAVGHPLSPEQLRLIAAELGSDIPLFIVPQMAVIRGRGEQVSPLLVPNWKGQRLLIAKPSFGVPTAQAYAWFAAQGRLTPAALAESELSQALASGQLGSVLALGNDLEAPVFAQLPQLVAGVKAVETRLGLRLQLTGSGSACIAAVTSQLDLGVLREVLTPHWGGNLFLSLNDLA